MGTHPNGDTGHMAHIIAKREGVLASNQNLPAATKARIEGKPIPFGSPSKAHRITVDIPTGARTVETTDLGPPKPVYLPFKAKAHIPREPRDPKPPKQLTSVQHLTVRRIIAVCAKHWEVNQGAITAEGKARCFVRPRHACYRLMRELLGLSLPMIGHLLNRDHTTVISAMHRTELLLETDPDWRARYEAAHAELKPADEP